MPRKPPPRRTPRSAKKGARARRRSAEPVSTPARLPNAQHPSFHHLVWDLVRKVPRGRATSYGAIAAYLGTPRAARGVGWAMAALPPDTDVPWWRVVNRNGEISIKGAPGLPALQRSLLQAEGIVFSRKGRIDFRKFGWEGPPGAEE